MKKLLSKFLTVILILGLSTTNLASAFTDLDNSHKNFPAINYLRQNQIIQGYQNDTFKPGQFVTRAEFTKVLIKSNFSETEINNCNTPYFPDVKESDWFFQYVCIAKSKGIIRGYQDNSFKPDQLISQVESLKIVGETQNWELASAVAEKPFRNVATTEWFAPYVAYSKEKGYLEDTGKFFLMNKIMTRANISELIYRSLTLEEPTTTLENEDKPEEEPAEKTEEEPEKTPKVSEEPPPENLNFTPHTYSTISTTFYTDITLNQEMPNTFYQNEIYILKGTLSSSDSEMTVILNKNSDQQDRVFEKEVTNKHFEIPIYFAEQGNYELGVLSGASGQYKVADISVLPGLPSNSGNTILLDQTTSLNVGFQSDQTYVSFNTADDTINKVYFEQGGELNYFISRQQEEKIYLDYRPFENFKEGNVNYYVKTAKISSQAPLKISSDFLTSSVETFYAVEHSFDEIDKTQIIANNVPDLKNNLDTISFSGSVLTDTQLDALIIKPNGFVDEKNLTTSSSTTNFFSNTIIQSDGNFSFNYTPTVKGRYIVEINNTNGLATLNHPVYVGGVIPLIPDFFDLNDATLFNQAFNLNQLRSDLLALINNARTKHGLNTIVMTDDLNSIAQAHSQDQVDQDFFGHINPQGQGPDDRRIAAGIKTSVGENIALSPSLEHIHYGLMRSAAHRENILTADWTRVGLGIAEHSGDLKGHITVTQEFSTDPISQTDLSKMKDELFEEINNKRSTEALIAFTSDSALDAVSENLNDAVINDKANITQALFEEALQANNIIGAATTVLRTAGAWSSTLESILTDESSITQSNWKTMGIDIQLDFDGLIYTIFTLNNPS